jgi:hypothetical protein
LVRKALRVILGRRAHKGIRAQRAPPARLEPRARPGGQDLRDPLVPPGRLGPPDQLGPPGPLALPAHPGRRARRS